MKKKKSKPLRARNFDRKAAALALRDLGPIDLPARTSGAELARRLGKMKPQPKAAKAVADAIKTMDEAS